MKISALIITYNEERNIRRCINSLISIADEIIVVDSYSTDKTVEICLEQGIQVIKNEFNGYIEQKNFIITHAKYKYILSIDADEVVSPELANSILKAKADCKFDGYEFNRKANYCGKWIQHCGWYPDRKLRLFDSSKGKWGGTNPHDKFIMKEGAKICFLKGDLLHYPYYSITQHLARVNYFTDIMAEEAVKNGKKSGVFYLIFSPLIKFIKSYFIQLGFLDGYYGFVVCTISSFATFVKYTKIIEFRKEKMNLKKMVLKKEVFQQ